MTSTSIDPLHTAMLGMDLQAGIVSVYTPNTTELVDRAAALLQQGRRAGVTVIHVKVGFRPGLPEVHSRNLLFGGIKASPQHQKLFSGVAGEIHPAVAPAASDLVVTKSRVNAFTGTDLELLLRAKEIDTLVLFGIATSGVVLSTALHASDADFRLFIIKDCCADQDQTVHTCLIEKVLPRRATVLLAEEFGRLLGKLPG